MTPALNAAVLAAWHAYSGEMEDIVIEAIRAALPAEPPAEAIGAMARGLARLRVQQNQEKWNRPPANVELAVEYAWKDFVEEAGATYRALRAHLLGEDA